MLVVNSNVVTSSISLRCKTVMSETLSSFFCRNMLHIIHHSKPRGYSHFITANYKIGYSQNKNYDSHNNNTAVFVIFHHMFLQANVLALMNVINTFVNEMYKTKCSLYIIMTFQKLIALKE